MCSTIIRDFRVIGILKYDLFIRSSNIYESCFISTTNLFVLICSKSIFVCELKQTKKCWYDNLQVFKKLILMKQSQNSKFQHWVFNQMNKLLDNWIMNKQDEIHLKKRRNLINVLLNSWNGILPSMEGIQSSKYFSKTVSKRKTKWDKW